MFCNNFERRKKEQNHKEMQRVKKIKQNKNSVNGIFSHFY